MTLLRLIKPNLFQGGYLDFTSSSYIAMGSYETGALKRTSMLDDILYYWKQAPKDSFPITDPLKSAIYAKKIAAANWMNALEYIQRSVGAFENRVDQLAGSLNGSDIDKMLEEKIFFVYELKRKCMQLCDDILENFTELRVLTGDDRPKETCEGAQDWIYIQMRLGSWTERTKNLVQAVSDLLTLTETKKTLDEAETTKILQQLGTVYLHFRLWQVF